MGLITCNECKGPVSSSATACPKCGAPVPKKTSTLTWIVGGTLAIAIGSCVSKQNDREMTRAAAPKPPPPTAAQLAETARKDREINIVLAGAQRLKDAMKKPESFELTSAIMLNGKVICYEYKARNSFNDVTKEHYVISDTVSSNKAKDWNALCAGKSGDDYTSVRAVMR